MESNDIYLDNNATTRVAPEVIEAMVRAMREGWGNPSSLHAYGEAAAQLVENARVAVAQLLGARSPVEILFTSGGTESINAALHAALSSRPPGSLILTSSTEHSAVKAPLERREREGFRVQRLDVDSSGRLGSAALLDALDREQAPSPGCALVSLQWANNETGALLTEDELGPIIERCRALGVPLHLDAVQVPGKLPMNIHALGVDLLSISAHKFHGPKGVGALYIREGALGGEPFQALIAGGPQEAERRGGTPNVPGIAGLGRAAELALSHMQDTRAGAHLSTLRERLESGLVERIPGARIHAAQAARLPNTTSVLIPGISGELLLGCLAAEGLAVSSGAACSARTRGPSAVLLAMGLDAESASQTLRFSLSRYTSGEEINATLVLVERVVEDLLTLGPA